MQIALDINANYEAQFISILQSLDKKFFNKIEIDSNSDFMKNQRYLNETLSKIESGKAEFINEEDFWNNLDSKFN